MALLSLLVLVGFVALLAVYGGPEDVRPGAALRNAPPLTRAPSCGPASGARPGAAVPGAAPPADRPPAAAPPACPPPGAAPSGSAPGAPTATPGDTPPSAAPGSAPPSAVPADCPATGVRLELDVADAAMGLRAMGMHLINCGRSPYRVTGYPAVRALDEQRTPLPAVRTLQGVVEIAGALPNWTDPPRPVELRPGERATAVIVWRNTYDNTVAGPADAPYLEVAPAAGRPVAVLTPDHPLDLGSTGRLGVSPWRKAGPGS